MTKYVLWPCIFISFVSSNYIVYHIMVNIYPQICTVLTWFKLSIGFVQYIINISIGVQREHSCLHSCHDFRRLGDQILVIGRGAEEEMIVNKCSPQCRWWINMKNTQMWREGNVIGKRGITGKLKMSEKISNLKFSQKSIPIFNTHCL